jgi:uncharacterized protein
VNRRAFLQTLIAGGVGAATGGAAYGYLYARHALTVTRTPVPVAGLAPGLEGFRIGFLSDVHRSRWVSADDVERAVGALMTEHPDMIVLGGDYVTWGDRQFVGPSAESLGSLSAPHGVYGIIGNHDDDRDMPAALAARGISMLKDARTQVVINDAKLELVGIRFWTKKTSDIASIVKGAEGTVVLLAHDPRRMVEAQALNIPLVLSGHTHGGQVVLPLAGAVAASKFPVVSGLARTGNTAVFVSRGVGTVYVPIRINCPPEVAVLTLQRA